MINQHLVIERILNEILLVLIFFFKAKMKRIMKTFVSFIVNRDFKIIKFNNLKSVVFLLILSYSFTNANGQTKALFPRDNEHAGPVTAPAANLLYKPKPELSGLHPRLFFQGVSVLEVKKRVTNPAYANIWTTIRENALRFAVVNPPETFDVTSENYRTQADYLTWLSLAYTLDSDKKSKAAYMKAIENWINAYYNFDRSNQDLVISHLLLGFSNTYDWLYNDLKKETRDKLHFLIVDQARWLRSPKNVGASMWRNKHYGANHNWYNNAALGMAAFALWGEQGVHDADEPQLWLNSAMRYYWEFQRRLSSEGLPIEGVLYSDYGIKPYLDFAVVAEQLTELSAILPLIDCPAIKNMGQARLSILLPNETGFMAWSDSYWKHFDGSWQFRFIASRFNDGFAQTLASIMEKKSNQYDWRNIFYYNSKIADKPLDSMPLYNQYNDLGIYTARNNWTGNQNFFGFKCGLAGGKEGTAIELDYCTGHCQPDANSVTFWWNEFPIIDMPGYERIKRASHHQLSRIVYKGQEVEQCGGGRQWFMLLPGECLNGYKDRLGDAQTLEIKQTKEYHTCLGESGGLYVLNYNPCTYRRRVVYFPTGSVVIADRITTPEKTDITFRLLTLCNDLSQDGKVFKFTAGNTPGTITDYSNDTEKREITSETVYAWDHSKTDGLPNERKVVNLTKTNTTIACFGAVINMDNNHITIEEINEKGIVVKSNTGEKLFFGWEKE